LQDCEILGYSGPAMVAQRVADLFPVDVRKDVNILDVGAGTGLVAIEVGFTYIN
jgi:predicted TPR repeat methyltransferase